MRLADKLSIPIELIRLMATGRRQQRLGRVDISFAHLSCIYHIFNCQRLFFLLSKWLSLSYP